MQDVESVKEAQGELPVVMGILKVLAFFHVQKGGGHKPSHRALWISVGLWILADQKAPKAFALSRLSFCEQKDRIRQRSKPLSMPSQCRNWAICHRNESMLSIGLLGLEYLFMSCPLAT